MNNKHGTKTLKKGRILINSLVKRTGYLRVSLSKNGKIISKSIHQLVATAFIPNNESKPHIDHINTIKDDNRADNLRWVTAKENSDNPISRKHYLDNSPTAGKFGKDHVRAKAVFQYSLYGKLIRKWGSIIDVQRELGFNHGHISACCLGKRKTCGCYVWQYA